MNINPNNMENLDQTPIEQNPLPQAVQSVQNSIRRKPSKPRNYDKKVHGKRYNLATKIAIAAMQGTGISATQAAAATGAHISTIVRAWENPELAELSPNVVQKTKIGLGGLFYKRALESTLAIDAEKIAQSSALQLATVAGIMTEKGRLMEGLSTENVSFRGIAQNLEADRAKLMAKLQDIQE